MAIAEVRNIEQGPVVGDAGPAGVLYPRGIARDLQDALPVLGAGGRMASRRGPAAVGVLAGPALQEGVSGGALGGRALPTAPWTFCRRGDRTAFRVPARCCASLPQHLRRNCRRWHYRWANDFEKPHRCRGARRARGAGSAADATRGYSADRAAGGRDNPRHGHFTAEAFVGRLGRVIVNAGRGMQKPRRGRIGRRRAGCLPRLAWGFCCTSGRCWVSRGASPKEPPQFPPSAASPPARGWVTGQ